MKKADYDEQRKKRTILRWPFFLLSSTVFFLAVIIIADVAFSEDHVEQLIATLKTGSPYFKYEAARKLGEIKDIRAVDPLIAALKDDSPDVRLRASEALGEIGDKRAIAPLEQLLQQVSDDYFKKYIAGALKKLTGKDYMVVEAQPSEVTAVKLQRVVEEVTLKTAKKYRWPDLGIQQTNADIIVDVKAWVRGFDIDSDPFYNAHKRLTKTGDLSGVLKRLKGIDKESFVVIPASDTDYLRFISLSDSFKSRLKDSPSKIIEGHRYTPISFKGIADFFGDKNLPDFFSFTIEPKVLTFGVPTGVICIGHTGSGVSSYGCYYDLVAEKPDTSFILRGTIRFDSDNWVPFFGGLYCKGGKAEIDNEGITLLPGTSIGRKK